MDAGMDAGAADRRRGAAGRRAAQIAERNRRCVAGGRDGIGVGQAVGQGRQ